jgi:hypothetical protein
MITRESRAIGRQQSGKVAPAFLVSFRMAQPVVFPPAIALALLMAIVSAVGCQTGGDMVSRCTPCSALARAVDSPGNAARHYYALACDAQQQEDPQACDYFYQAAICSWPLLVSGDGESLGAADAWYIYQTSLGAFLLEAQRQGRFAAGGKVTVRSNGTAAEVPFNCLGLSWHAHEVRQILLTAPQDSQLENYHSAAGVGVPVVAVREPGPCPDEINSFLPSRTPFAATALLRPLEGETSDAVLELYDPRQFASAKVGGDALPLARDISAPFVYQKETAEDTSVLGFLNPDVPEQAEGLRFIEPYQPGKIPVVFVHGLLSDPSTWFNTANDLRTERWFNDRYQIWAFRYASGKPFVTSAMQLRRQLQRAVATLDPEQRDPALRRMVLVGHSMGGLISKLQVSSSEDRIWNSFANIPFSSLRAPERVRAELAERCFFEPLPFVSRVVFIATPHGGSSFATRGMGRVASSLVNPAAANEAMHDRLVAANPGVFTAQFERRLPTSIDLLEPDDPTLQTIRTLPVASGVRLHSIIGTGQTMMLEGPGDGVVSVESALHPGVRSQRFVEATHTRTQYHPDTVAELRLILRQHLAQ